jgi:hypothetical protein
MQGRSSRLADTPRQVGIVHNIVSLVLPDFGSRERNFASYTEMGYSNPFNVPRKQNLPEGGTHVFTREAGARHLIRR